MGLGVIKKMSLIGWHEVVAGVIDALDVCLCDGALGGIAAGHVVPMDGFIADCPEELPVVPDANNDGCCPEAA